MFEWNGFRDGDRYHEIFSTPRGDLLLEASLKLEIEAVVLRDVLVEPLMTKQMPVGTAAMLRILRSLLDAARAQGYTYVSN